MLMNLAQLVFFPLLKVLDKTFVFTSQLISRIWIKPLMATLTRSLQVRVFQEINFRRAARGSIFIWNGKNKYM